jgi:sporulation protein YlmC with PRC-barrel domain
MSSITNTENTTGRLIAAGKVSGTSVYNSVSEKLGSIYEVMLDKKSGKADYAIMSFGGFLGMGEKYHPLPWNQLRYDPNLGGFVVNLDKRMLEGAPAYDSGDASTWGDESWGGRVDDYYGAPVRTDPGLVAPGASAVPPSRF